MSLNKVSIHWAAIAVAIGTFCSARTTWAAVEAIDWQVVVNQPIEQYFPNEEHPDYPKNLLFEGTVANPTGTDGALVMFFDWVDLDDPSIIHTSTPITIPLSSGAQVGINVTETIPFCPPQVSLHARTADAPLLDLDGTFTHTCQVPEPSTRLMATLSLLLLGTGLVARHP